MTIIRCKHRLNQRDIYYHLSEIEFLKQALESKDALHLVPRDWRPYVSDINGKSPKTFVPLVSTQVDPPKTVIKACKDDNVVLLKKRWSKYIQCKLNAVD